jgi:hypothetical protein
MLLRLLPVVIACLLLAAHFLRMERFGLVAASVAAAALLFTRKRWAARTAQAALAIGTLEWLRTTYVFVAHRRAAGQPYARLVVILGSVAAFTALSTLAFRNAKVRERFGLTDSGAVIGNSRDFIIQIEAQHLFGDLRRFYCHRHHGRHSAEVINPASSAWRYFPSNPSIPLHKHGPTLFSGEKK